MSCSRLRGFALYLDALEASWMGTYSRISQEIQETLAAFTACTALPISALTLEGAVLGYAGSKLPGALDVDKLKAAYEKVALRLESCELTPWPIHLNWTATRSSALQCPSLKESQSRYYLIGPFSRSQLHACPLVGLLRQIQASKVSKRFPQSSRPPRCAMSTSTIKNLSP